LAGDFLEKNWNSVADGIAFAGFRIDEGFGLEFQALMRVGVAEERKNGGVHTLG
jgi:hypothetical protein